ncbi:MAG: zinc ribbon domain-containing protein [Clostridia bacterium]|nr:zinc ribbon domain-containing protein [Clostridia bacterium]
MSSEASSKPIYEQKCPQCGAPLVFDPQLGKMKCEWCGCVTEVEQAVENEAQIDAKERDTVLETMEPLPIYNCVSCGAQVIAPAESGALTCPYCKNHIVLTEQFSGKIKPDGIIPFKIPPKKLQASVREYYKDKKLLPKTFFSKSRLGPVTGIYVPFWLFDCDVSGSASYNASKPGKSYTVGDYYCMDTDHYRLDRTVSMQFANLAVDASKRIADDLMDTVQPYDFSELKPFDVQYLAGFVADRFDESARESQKRSDARVLRTGADVVASLTTKGYSHASTPRNSMKADVTRARYVLLPVYLLHVEFEKKQYEFAVNGQTGRVVGKLPDMKLGERIWYWKFFAAGFAAAAAAIAALVIR